MIEVAGLNELHGAGKCVRGEPNVGVGEEKPIARRSLVCLLKGMRFAEPACRKFRHVDDAESTVVSCSIVEDGRCTVARTIVDGNDFEIGIGDSRKSLNSERKLFLFI